MYGQELSGCRQSRLDPKGSQAGVIREQESRQRLGGPETQVVILGRTMSWQGRVEGWGSGRESIESRHPDHSLSPGSSGKAAISSWDQIESHKPGGTVRR